MSDNETELQNLIGGGKKGRGCCSSHPVLCTVVLSVLLALSVSFVVLGAAFQATIDHVVQDAIGQHVKLTENSTATSEFVHSDAPLYTIYYLFNVTNAHDVQHNAAIPKLQQLGPYAYRENRTCFDLRWSDNDTILHYKTNTTYTYDATQSGPGLNPQNDNVISINLPLIGLFQTVQSMDSKWVNLLMKVLDELKGKADWDGLFVKHKVHDLLWGYTDPILNELHKGHNLIHFIPDENPTFGLGNLSSIEEPNAVYTGVDDLSKVAQYIMWNNHTSMNWNNSWADMINGTGGYSFHPGVVRNETLYIFIDELYRSGYFEYREDFVDHGITLYKFVLPDDELLNTTQVAAGFPGGNPNGVLNMSLVVPANLPLFASKPHFLHADPAFRDNVTGMHPNPDIHDSYVGVEPITGAVMNAAKRIQLNIKLDRSTLFPEMESLRDSTMLPIYYAEQTGAVTTPLANEFKDAVFTVRYGVLGSVWALIGLSGLLSLVFTMCLFGVCVQQMRRRKTSAFSSPRRQVQQYDGI